MRVARGLATLQRDKSALFSPYDMIHPNEAGHALIAELIYQRMSAAGWLPEGAP